MDNDKPQDPERIKLDILRTLKRDNIADETDLLLGTDVPPPNDFREAIRSLEKDRLISRKPDFFKKTGFGDGFELTKDGLRKVNND